MIRIAALDDDKNCIKIEKELTERYLQNEECEFEGYTSTSKFLFSVEEKEYDIVLLDMELPEENGLQVGKKVKQYHPDSIIIYITNYVEYAVEAFEVNAFRYIPKKILKEKLPQAYEAVLSNLHMKENRYFVVKNNSKMEKIQEDQIYFLRKEKKYVYIIHKMGQSKIRLTLDEAAERLKGEEFVRIDRGCIVNLKHIMSLERHQVKMRDGTMLPVSQPQLANVKRRISEYWSER